MNYAFDVLTQMNNLVPQFSQTELKLAEFIQTDPQLVVNLSISELAEHCGVSVATISRFCRHLTLNGYQDFRLELMRSLTNATASETDSATDIRTADPVPVMISKMGAQYNQAFAKAIAGLDVASFTRICDLMVEAEDVYFVGMGNMLPVALAAKIQFMDVSKKFHCDLDGATQALSTAMMDGKSLVIMFSHSGENIMVTEVAKFAKARGAKVVAITRYSQSALADLADELLLCSVSRSFNQYSSLHYCSGLQFIVDLMYTEYCRRDPEATAANKQKTKGTVIGEK